MYKLTSFTVLTTGEGKRVAYTYSEIDDDENVTSQNNKANFVASDETVLECIDSIETYIQDNKLSS